jgi:hypothetical protein
MPVVGDIGDFFYTANSPTNGSPFTMRGTVCSNSLGPWWYSSAYACAYIRVFGPINNGFLIDVGGAMYLNACRMMIKPT